jgi:hypothetical protein
LPFPTKIQSKLNWLFLYVLVWLVLVLFRNLYQILFLYVLVWLVLVLFRNPYQILFLNHKIVSFTVKKKIGSFTMNNFSDLH